MLAVLVGLAAGKCICSCTVRVLAVLVRMAAEKCTCTCTVYVPAVLVGMAAGKAAVLTSFSRAHTDERASRILQGVYNQGSACKLHASVVQLPVLHST